MRKKLLNSMVTILLVGFIMIEMPQQVFAGTQTKTKETRKGEGYDVVTMTVSTGPSDLFKKIDCLGFEKVDNTSGSITITKSKSYTFNASTSLTTSLESDFALVKSSFSTSYTVGLSETVNADVGVTVNIGSKKKNGIYYAYYGMQERKVTLSKKWCSKNHTNWSNLYSKTIKYAPVVNSGYLSVKTGDVDISK